MNRHVVAIIATLGRPAILARLLATLKSAGVDEVVVVDNGASLETRAVMSAATVPAHYVASETNLGCGGGLRLAAETALRLEGYAVTHLMVVDDDAVLPPGAVDGFIDAMRAENAGLAHALVIGPDGKVGWPAGIGRTFESRFSAGLTPDQLYTEIGTNPIRFIWAQGICLIVAREAIDAAGLHRTDFWIRGEDLEFTLRLTNRFRGIVAPSIVVQHLPPPPTSSSREIEYLKHCAMIQNVAFIGLRLPHGRRIAWTILPNIGRLIRNWGWGALGNAFRALWRGAVCGEPAGAGTGETFMARAAKLQHA